MAVFEIIPYGNGLDYLIGSRSRKGHHMVVMDDHDGNGSCSCEDFAMRRYPLFKIVGTPCDDTRCEHIKAARRYLLDKQIIPKLHQMRPKEDENPS